MIRIGLLSDTHGYLDNKIFDYFSECDEIWHAGDIGSLEIVDRLRDFRPTKMVYGNIDGAPFRSFLPKNLFFELEGFRIWMTHIGGYPSRYPKVIKEQLSYRNTDIFVCGHSHILKVIRDHNYNCLTMNPGACGNYGIHQVKTLLRFSLNKGKILDMQVIELGARGR